MRGHVVPPAGLLPLCIPTPAAGGEHLSVEPEDLSSQEYQDNENGTETFPEDLAISTGEACRAACAGAAAAGCMYVTRVCAATTVFTVGGAAIPCAWAEAAACVGGAMGAAICADRCPR